MQSIRTFSAERNKRFTFVLIYGIIFQTTFGGVSVLTKEEKYLEVRNRRVRKANELIQKGRFALSLQQQKIILYLISQIQPNDEEFKIYEFDIAEFCKVCGIEVDSGRNYEMLREQIKLIADKSMWIRLADGTDSLLRWIEKPQIQEGSGKIRIRLDNDMKPFLLQLKERYTTYELIWTLYFRSKYTIRLYELIKSIHYHELETYTKRYSLEEITELLDAKTYKTYQTLKTRVLIPATEEITKYSDKNISFSTIRKGKKVIGIEFIITTKDTLEIAKIRSDIEKEMGTSQMTVWDMLAERGYIDE